MANTLVRRLHRLFYQYYCLIAYLVLVTLSILGFLHYQLIYYGKDLLFWQRLLLCNWQQPERCTSQIVAGIIAIKLIVIVTLLYNNIRRLNDKSQLEIRKHYAAYLLVRLFSEIDYVEQKYLDFNTVGHLEPFEVIIMAHRDLVSAVEAFRKDARKLIAPNELEVTMPIEEVYGLLDEEEAFLRQSRFNYLREFANEELIKSLINP